eukprot:3063610-Pleurochrysis_carterae.AAC.1
MIIGYSQFHSISHYAYAALPNSFAMRTAGMAAAASVALRRSASGPDSPNAATIRRIGRGMPS